MRRGEGERNYSRMDGGRVLRFRKAMDSKRQWIRFFSGNFYSIILRVIFMGFKLVIEFN